MQPQTNPLDTPPEAFTLVLPNGRSTTVAALVGEAHRARSLAQQDLLRRGWRHAAENLHALCAPLFGLTRRRLHRA